MKCDFNWANRVQIWKSSVFEICILSIFRCLDQDRHIDKFIDSLQCSNFRFFVIYILWLNEFIYEHSTSSKVIFNLNLCPPYYTDHYIFRNNRQLAKPGMGPMTKVICLCIGTVIVDGYYSQIFVFRGVLYNLLNIRILFTRKDTRYFNEEFPLFFRKNKMICLKINFPIRSI